MAIPRRRKRALAIDMTPMIDCVFQLLIFFMLSSTMNSPQLALELPRASASEEAPPAEIVISAARDGQVQVNGQPVAVGDLSARLHQLRMQMPAAQVTFRGDKQLPYNLVMQIMDAAQLAGIRNLNLAHE